MRRLAASASGATSGPMMADDGRFRQAAAYPSMPCPFSSTAIRSAKPGSRLRTRPRSAPNAARSTARIDGRSASVAGRTHSAGPPGPVWPGRAAGTPSPARPPATAAGRNVPTNDTLRRTDAKPSFSYSGLPRSVANSVTVASPASASRCSISARPRPRRAYLVATSIMPTDARSGPQRVSTTAPASRPPRGTAPSGASTPKASEHSSSSAHLARSGDQPRSTESATQRLRSPGPSLRMRGNESLVTAPEVTGVPPQPASGFPADRNLDPGSIPAVLSAPRFLLLSASHR